MSSSAATQVASQVSGQSVVRKVSQLWFRSLCCFISSPMRATVSSIGKSQSS
jgi:hypothetical protein